MKSGEPGLSTLPASEPGVVDIYMGAQLSEDLKENDTNSAESGFSRRRVVAGAVWSVPVILTAVAVPPASASPGPALTLSMAFDAPVTQGFSIARFGNNGVGTARNGSGPTKIIVQNASVTISGTIIVTAAGAVDSRSWIAPKSLGSSGTATLGTTTWGAARASTTPFSLTGGATAEYPISFQYNDESKPASGSFSYVVSISLGGSEASATSSLMMAIA
ncbi:hypothetical protein DXK94_13335 [Arthrobacter sp. RT-1]|nr:hypothetical protein DXK94_13335 [Arthrobacter sp. RT-1]